MQAESLGRVCSLYFDAGLGQILATSRISDFVYAINPTTLAWKWWRSGYNIALARVAAGRVVAASLYDGVVMAPQADVPSGGQK